ncbi:MAG: 5-methyltetrahydropteroyltriglutamate--homocysteine S-methyltransferase [Betaproteobacteria bacterium]
MTPPFRADHIGSLLRPQKLRQAFRAHAANQLSDADFRAAQDDAIRDVLRLQEDCGLEVVTDGEFRRISYWEKFVRLTRGLVVKEAVFRFHDEHGHETDFTAPYAETKVDRTEPITLDEYDFASRLTARVQKVTMPAPSTMHLYRFSDWGARSAYEDPRAFFADLGKVYQAEIADLHQAGCRYVQLDEVALAMLCDPALQSKVRAGGGDPDALVDLYVDAINEAVKGAPADMSIGIHMCRGNYKGMYLSEGGYTSIAERLFNRARVTHFLLEFDTQRAGDFAPLAMMPKSKGVVLGLVSSKTPRLESIELLQRRVEEAAGYIDPAQCAISPQCGFASTMGGNPVTEGDERAKLRLCVEAARRIWG